MSARTMFLTGDAAADRLLAKDPLALTIGMLLDQQVTFEKAFHGPADLAERLGGTLDAAAIATMDPDRLVELFRQKPAIHRYPAAMAHRVQQLCGTVVADYAGRATAVWTEAADGADALARVAALPGFGDQKARIFVALLGKQYGLRAKGWEAVSNPYGDPGTFRSVADIVDEASRAKVRAFKQSMKATAKATAKAMAQPEATARSTARATLGATGRARTR